MSDVKCTNFEYKKGKSPDFTPGTSVPCLCLGSGKGGLSISHLLTSRHQSSLQSGIARIRGSIVTGIRQFFPSFHEICFGLLNGLFLGQLGLDSAGKLEVGSCQGSHDGEHRNDGANRTDVTKGHEGQDDSQDNQDPNGEVLHRFCSFQQVMFLYGHTGSACDIMGPHNFHA